MLVHNKISVLTCSKSKSPLKKTQTNPQSDKIAFGTALTKFKKSIENLIKKTELPSKRGFWESLFKNDKYSILAKEIDGMCGNCIEKVSAVVNVIDDIMTPQQTKLFLQTMSDNHGRFIQRLKSYEFKDTQKYNISASIVSSHIGAFSSSGGSSSVDKMTGYMH